MDTRPRLLWIDDEILPKDACVRLLMLEGYEVDCVPSVSAALRAVATRRYDAIILDLMLGDDSGLTMLDALRDRRLTTPVLVLTGHADLESCKAAVRNGAWDYQSKLTMLDDEWLHHVRRLVDEGTGHVVRGAGYGHATGDECLSRIEAAAKVSSVNDAGMVRARLSNVLLEIAIELDPPPPLFLAVVEAFKTLHKDLSPASVDELGRTACSIVREATARRCDMHHAIARRVVNLLRDRPRSWREARIAQEFNLSESRFCRAFYDAVGIHYPHVRAAITLQRAIRDAVRTDEHFTVIAYNLGYEWPTQFSHEFGRAFGVRPKELRRRWKDGAWS